MRIKSEKYLPSKNENEEEAFVECRTLLPHEETLLFENSILNELSAKDAELAMQEQVKLERENEEKEKLAASKVEAEEDAVVAVEAN